VTNTSSMDADRKQENSDSADTSAKVTPVRIQSPDVDADESKI